MGCPRRGDGFSCRDVSRRRLSRFASAVQWDKTGAICALPAARVVEPRRAGPKPRAPRIRGCSPSPTSPRLDSWSGCPGRRQPCGRPATRGGCPARRSAVVGWAAGRRENLPGGWPGARPGDHGHRRQPLVFASQSAQRSLDAVPRRPVPHRPRVRALGARSVKRPRPAACWRSSGWRDSDAVGRDRLQIDLRYAENSRANRRPARPRGAWPASLAGSPQLRSPRCPCSPPGALSSRRRSPSLPAGALCDSLGP